MLNRAWIEREAPLARCPMPECRRSGTCHHSTDSDPCRRLHESRAAFYTKLARKIDRIVAQDIAARPPGVEVEEALPGTPEFERRLKILYDAMRARDIAESAAEMAQKPKKGSGGR